MQMRPIDADALEKDYRMQFESVYKHTRSVVNPSDFYIERMAAYNKELVKMDMEAFFEYLKSRPIIDAVEVVRCKDCKYWQHIPLVDVMMCYGSMHGNWTSPNDFCSYGRRKDAEVEK